MATNQNIAKVGLGPDRLCLLWEIAACYFPAVIYSLLFLDNSLLCWKIVNFFLIILKNTGKPWLVRHLISGILEIVRFL